MACDITPIEKARQPLLLKYRNLDEHSMVREYTLTVPWVTLRRLCEQSKQANNALNAIPGTTTEFQ